MTHNFHEVPRHHWLVRYYRAQLRFTLHVLGALWLVPRPVAAAGFAWLRRTEAPKRGTTVKSSSRSKILVPVLIVAGVVALIFMLIARWHSPDAKSGTPNSHGTTIPGEPAVQLEAWRRPTTTDPQEFAIAYARAIWTYDTRQHSYVDWQNAVSVYADPSSAAPQVAKSLLPQWADWDQLQLHKARATVGTVTAEITPELEAMVNRSQAPKGWHAYVVHGKQTVVMDTDTRFLERQAAVAVVCTPTCKFWSATAQVSP
ncbi:hypothetical protein OHA18_41525 [Kribbella sp. NBC_00709]|uniref:hypothetical protein n=1 Tax=Kribbella sp. NBC_00709 TaxID=2975972 RepID=UPI002E28F71C|nr:hypothetical protein [Kribbella sp. NBC_00709]